MPKALRALSSGHGWDRYLALPFRQPRYPTAYDMRGFSTFSLTVWGFLLGGAGAFLVPQPPPELKSAQSSLIVQHTSAALLPDYGTSLPKLSAADLDARKLGPTWVGEPTVSLSTEHVILAKANPPEMAQSEGRPMWVGRKSVNLRSGPSVASPKLRTLTPSAAVRVTETQGSWAAVTLSSGETGWVALAFLNARPNSPQSPRPKPIGQKQKVVTTARLASDAVLRSTPSRSAARVLALSAGDVVRVLERRSGWALVTVGGQQGWVRLQ